MFYGFWIVFMAFCWLVSSSCLSYVTSRFFFILFNTTQTTERQSTEICRKCQFYVESSHFSKQASLLVKCFFALLNLKLWFTVMTQTIRHLCVFDSWFHAHYWLFFRRKKPAFKNKLFCFTWVLQFLFLPLTSYLHNTEIKLEVSSFVTNFRTSTTPLFLLLFLTKHRSNQLTITTFSFFVS